MRSIMSERRVRSPVRKSSSRTGVIHACEAISDSERSLAWIDRRQTRTVQMRCARREREIQAIELVSQGLKVCRTSRYLKVMLMKVPCSTRNDINPTLIWDLFWPQQLSNHMVIWSTGAQFCRYCQRHEQISWLPRFAITSVQTNMVHCLFPRLNTCRGYVLN